MDLMKIDTILLDMGNVLVDFVPMAFCAQVTTDAQEASALAFHVFYSPAWHRLDEGLISEAEALTDILRSTPDHLKAKANVLFDQWDEWMTQKAGMEAVLWAFKAKGIRLILCSNASVRYHRYIQRLSIFSALDVLYYSCDLKLMKPGVDIFQSIQTKEGFDFTSTLFVDDALSNLQTAHQLGMATYHFNGDVASFETYCRKMKLL